MVQSTKWELSHLRAEMDGEWVHFDEPGNARQLVQ